LAGTFITAFLFASLLFSSFHFLNVVNSPFGRRELEIEIGVCLWTLGRYVFYGFLCSSLHFSLLHFSSLSVHFLNVVNSPFGRRELEIEIGVCL
jgi:hypothetical protein